ncbi:DUF3667 domain-containing protein [Aquincola sp. S2]|uniref:DUF3667 domain-containing protein n=1 Tax=Pseudaquabacterium terrae TaxID=2732868 RepID=A0ABX2EMV0_9BURK|nr:DUF3667 domain-containing protein [Aquabacterium terrae]NRF69981.1 DUF3667 domain-containing protein [Aquabacterium terrae]
MSGPTTATCRNCGALLPLALRPRYCPQCGQETALHAPSFWEFVHEFVGHYVALEGTLWRTLALLLLKPGRLTREYFAGRRRRYVLPLRLYLSASFLFFVIVKLFGFGDTRIHFAAGLDAQGRPVTVASSPALAEDLKQAGACLARGDACPLSERLGARLQLQLAKTADAPQAVQQRLGSMAPYTVFLMLPVFAAIVQLAYRRRRMNYGAHVVFSLHMHAFWFIALLAMSLLPAVLTWPLLGLIVVYGLWALQHVYQGRWWATALRALAISVSYALLFVFALLAMVALAVLRS